MLRMNRQFAAGGTGHLQGGYAPASNMLRFWGQNTLRANGFGRTVSVPGGYGRPVNNLLAPAITAGAMSTRKSSMSVSASAIGSEGVSTQAAAALSVGASAAGSLIAGGVATCVMSVSGTASIFAVLSTTASCSMSVSGEAAIEGIGNAVASCEMEVGGSADLQGCGWMVATTEHSAEMTEATIAAAVWAKILGGAIPAEDALLAAGSAGDPWSAVIDGELAGDILALIRTRVKELHLIQGLEAGSPMTVTPANRIAGDVELEISGDGISSTTVERK